MRYYFYVMTGLFALDRLSKVLALSWLSHGDIALFPACRLSLEFNKGISWSLFSHMNVIPLVCCVTLLFGIYSMYRTYYEDSFIPEQLVFIGALSNVFDRFFYEGVIDFVECFIGNYQFPTFNIADCYVTFGVIWMLWRQRHEFFR